MIIAPFLLGVLVILAMLVVVILLPTRDQVEVVSGAMLVAFVLCPTLLIVFLIFMGFVAAIYGMGRLHTMTDEPFERLDRVTSAALMRVEKTTTAIDHRMIGVQARLAPVYRLMRFFDATEIESGEHNDE
jgi:quinol-cytochrome oxidoreductase complex cytochrome b subunit